MQQFYFDTMVHLSYQYNNTIRDLRGEIQALKDIVVQTARSNETREQGIMRHNGKEEHKKNKELNSKYETHSDEPSSKSSSSSRGTAQSKNIIGVTSWEKEK